MRSPVVYVNRAFEALLGYAASDLVGLSSDPLHGAVLGDVAAIRARLMLDQRFHGDLALRHRDERELEVDCAVVRVADGNGHPPCNVSTLRDATERRNVEKELDRMLRVIEQSTDTVTVTNRHGVIEYANPAFEALSGYSRAETLGQTMRLIRSGEHPASFYAGFLEKIHAGHTYRGVFTNRHKNGELYYVDTIVAPLRDASGAITHFMGTGRDTTARRRVEEKLRANELRVHRLLELSSDVVTIVNAQAEIAYQSPSAMRVFGQTHGENVGKNLFAPFHPEDVPRVREAFAALMVTPDATAEATARVRHSDGSWRVIESVGRNLLHDPMVGGIVFNARDITEQTRAVEALHRSEATFRALIEDLPDAVLIHRSGRVVYVNRRSCEALGYTPAELIGRPVLEIVHADDRELVLGSMRKMVEEGASSPTVERFLRRDGTTLAAEVVAMPLAFDGQPAVVAVARDLSERLQLQAQLMLADRMASMGTLAAGVAHEINNPLAYVIANLGFAHDTLRALVEESRRPALAASSASAGAATARLEQTVEALVDAREGAERVRLIVRDLKTFSRGDDTTQHPIDVRKVLESCVAMAANEIRHRARLVRELGAVPHVFGNESRLGQVFLNLLVNAAQAIPDGRSDTQEILLRTRTAPDGSAVVEIADTGPGLAPGVREQLFAPFFTTKPIGIGTGLGLSICRDIVTAMQGTIEVESEPGHGALFRVTLPAAPEVASTAAPTVNPTPVSAARARVLVIDDEPQVALVAARILRRRHDVQVASTAEEAVEWLAGGARFDAVVCDLMMPVMSGMQFHAELQRRFPALCPRILFVTGGAFTQAAAAFLASVPNPRLEKPFDPDELMRLVNEQIAAGR